MAQDGLWPPTSIGRAIGARQDDLVSVGIIQPELPVIGAAIAIRRIAVPRQEDLGAKRLGPADGGTKVVDLEPEEQAIAKRHIIGVANAAVVMLFFEAVQLENEAAAVL